MLPKPLWEQYVKNGCQAIDAPAACDNIVNQMDDLTSTIGK
jgi:hypothetical protein